MGLNLIEALADQIGAKPIWTAGPEPGTTLILEFGGGG
jgi:hypothetical protein